TAPERVESRRDPFARFASPHGPAGIRRRPVAGDAAYGRPHRPGTGRRARPRTDLGRTLHGAGPAHGVAAGTTAPVPRTRTHARPARRRRLRVLPLAGGRGRAR